MTALRRAAALMRAAPADPTGQIIRRDPLDLLGWSRAKRRLITTEIALSVTTVWRAANILANVAASMPVHVYQDSDTTGRKQITLDSERYIWAKPNPEVNRFIFWATVYFQLVLTGNAYIYVVKDPTAIQRRPAELWPIDPKRVLVWREDGRKRYLIDGTTPATDWLNGDKNPVIVHIQGLGTDGIKGMSPIALFAQSIGLALGAEEYAAAFFGNSSAPGGYLSTDQDISADQAQELSEWWEEQHLGSPNAHRLAVLGKGTKWNSTTLNPEDAQLLATRQFQVADVARMFGVPEHLLGAHDKQSSWGTGISEQNRGLLIYTLDPFVQNVELTISEELLMTSNHYAKFSREGLLRGDPSARADFYTKMVGIGVYTPNEVRELEDEETIGPEGDIRLRPANMVPLDSPAPAPGAPVAAAGA